MTRAVVVAGAVAAALLVSGMAGCTSDRGPHVATSAGSGLDVPTDPYPPFPYASTAQRLSFKSYLSCARRLGVSMEGPYADSNGEGAMFRLTPGTDEPSSAARTRVMHRCPQGTVALALTPDPNVETKALKRVLRRFADCAEAHGAQHFSPPQSGSAGDPLRGLVWPLNWKNGQFLHAAQMCIGPVRDFTLAG